MKIVKEETVKPVAFCELDAGIVFAPVDADDCFYMSCYDVRDYEYPDDDVLNAISIGDDNDSGAAVHFDDTDMVIPYYNCTLKIS